MRKRVCYIVSHVQKSFGFEWTATRLTEKYDLSFILLNPDDSPLEQFLKAHSIGVTRINYRSKRDFARVLLKVVAVLRSVKPDVLHAHLLDGQLIGLTAARMLGIKKRVYTRHNSNFHHVYHPSGVQYDRWSNRLATHIVSISQATDHTLTSLENVSATKIRKITHGFNFGDFVNPGNDRVEFVKKKWSIPSGRPVLGVIARHIEWKGIQYVIPAVGSLMQKYPDAVLVLANASGPYHEVVEKLLKEHNVPAITIPFEEDVAALYKTFTVYVHTPVDMLAEAFGQTYVEALAMGVPSVFTLSGIAAEFIRDGQNALAVPFRDSKAIGIAVEKLLQNDTLRAQLQKKGMDDVFSRFGIEKMVARLEALYDE